MNRVALVIVGTGVTEATEAPLEKIQEVRHNMLFGLKNARATFE